MSLKITLAVCRRTILLSLIICYIPTCFSSWFDTVPIIHNIQWLPTENTTFLYTRKLTDHRLISLHRQISGLREFLSELPQRQRLILIEFPPELQYIELCYHEATTWSRLPAYTLLDKTREAPIRENLFPKILPAPLDLSCTELGMTDGERLSLLSTDPVELARLAGLKLIELPARNPNDKKQGVSSVPGRGQKLPRSSFSLPSEPGPDDNWFPPPSPGSNIWEIMSPFFQGRMVENHSETIHRQGKPVLRLILQQGLLLEGIAPSGQVILRHFVPVLQMEAFLQWFMNFKPEMTRQWLGVDWQGEYLISGHQAAAAITHLYSQEMARKFRSPEHRSQSRVTTNGAARMSPACLKHLFPSGVRQNAPLKAKLLRHQQLRHQHICQLPIRSLQAQPLCRCRFLLIGTKVAVKYLHYLFIVISGSTLIALCPVVIMVPAVAHSASVIRRQ